MIAYLAPDLARCWPWTQLGASVLPVVADAMGVSSEQAGVAFVEVPAGGGARRSAERIDEPAVQAALRAHGVTALLLFKPTHAGVARAQALGFEVLAGDCAVAQRFEHKAHFHRWAQGRGLAVAPGLTCARGAPDEADVKHALGPPPWVVQAARGHSGQGTTLAPDLSAYRALAAAITRGATRVTRWLPGPTLTVNGVAAPGARTRVGAPYAQLTGWPACTPHPLGACGNQWPSGERAPEPEVARLAEAVGDGLAEAGYRGAFGVDVVCGPGGPALIEVNPRVVSGLALELLRAPAGDAPGRWHLDGFGVRVPRSSSTPGPGPGATAAAPLAQLVFYGAPSAPSRPVARPSGRYRLADGALRWVDGALDPRRCAPSEVVLWWRHRPWEGEVELARAQWPGLATEAGAPTPFAAGLAAAVRRELDLKPPGAQKK